MNDTQTIDALNEMLAAEYGSLIHRLAEASPNVTWPAAGDGALAQEMLEDVHRHQRSLVEMILKLRGSPVSPRYPTETGSVHYLNLSYLMPQVIASERSPVKAYESGMSRVQHPEAMALVVQILDQHKRHLEALMRIHANLVPQSAG